MAEWPTHRIDRSEALRFGRAFGRPFADRTLLVCPCQLVEILDNVAAFAPAVPAMAAGEILALQADGQPFVYLQLRTSRASTEGVGDGGLGEVENLSNPRRGSCNTPAIASTANGQHVSFYMPQTIITGTLISVDGPRNFIEVTLHLSVFL